MKIRKGQCNMCGKCCTQNWRFAYTADIYDNDSKFHEFDPETLVAEYRTSRPEGYRPCMEMRIQDNKVTCDLHESGLKPQICRDWPFVESDIQFESCGYYFVEEGEDDE